MGQLQGSLYRAGGAKCCLRQLEPYLGVGTVLFAMSVALGVPWDQHGVVTGMRTDSNKTSDMLPLTPGKTETAQGS